MRSLTAIAALALIACGSTSKGDKTTPGSGSGKGDGGNKTQPPPPRGKVLHLALEYVVLDPDIEPPTSRVSLILTDETGAARREVIGEFQGGCSDVSIEARREKLEPIMGLNCYWESAGIQLRFVKRRGVLNVLRGVIEEGTAEVELEPLKSIEMPAGTAVKTDYDASGPPGESEADSG